MAASAAPAAPPAVLLAAVLAVSAAVSQQHARPQPIWREKTDSIAGSWDGPPGNVPTSSSQAVADGPFSGNGDLGVTLQTNNHTGGTCAARGAVATATWLL